MAKDPTMETSDEKREAAIEGRGGQTEYLKAGERVYDEIDDGSCMDSDEGFGMKADGGARWWCRVLYEDEKHDGGYSPNEGCGSYV
ncbi:hypothetical protein L2E82_08362 [Cichorium intybus]|uniref:Uncharacterized protein n=1 Tax=Cichorium intybus TaxID=13427 RepID=A0ACB9G6D4_CICIN|nr:hypothetical protein L2E82_08362 [Cichorium intybus]